ncbi:MAG TPA: type II toxin-antitoxin system Phd/YefM family antitoxin [Dissulfurispiraceae bacterium]|nr:type II toxin-antitoxin system Phd/YefM family antitoxin [Dissulfurispiraceae bacterium]
MKLSEAIKPISYIKAHASEVVREVNESRSPVIITLNGEATAVLQGIREYEQMQESLALLKIVAQGRKSVEAGRVQSMKDMFRELRHATKAD